MSKHCPGQGDAGLGQRFRIERRKTFMKPLAIAALIALGAGAATAAPAGHDPAEHGHAAPAAETPAGLNPVQHEMRLLADAMNVIMLAVANNDLKAIPPAISKVHSARMVTEQALLSGKYQPPKNSKQVQAFIKQDEAFHDELVTLMKAVRTNDLNAATRQVGVIVNSCTSCHTQYRF
jgi:hypothetical protein